MANVIDTYAETRTHNGQKLEITIRVYDEPARTNDVADFYTHIDITHHGHPWGAVFLKDPISEENFKQAIEDVYNHIEIYKTVFVSNEPSKT